MIVIRSRNNRDIKYLFSAVAFNTSAIEQGSVCKDLTGKVIDVLDVKLKDPSLESDSDTDSDQDSIYEPGSNPKLEEKFKFCCPPEVLALGPEKCINYIKFLGWPRHSNKIYVYTVDTTKTTNEKSES